jgi:Protein of unknown function (DUF3717)
MNFTISEIEAAIDCWRRRAPSDAEFASSAVAWALARLYGAVIVERRVITDAELDDAQRDALRIVAEDVDKSKPH